MAIGIGIEVTRDARETCVRVHGDLDMETAPHLDEALAAIGPGEHSVVIDLSDVEFLDSSGLTVLVEHWQRLQHAAEPVDLRLLVGGPAVTRVIEVAGMAPVFHLHASDDVATEP